MTLLDDIIQDAVDSTRPLPDLLRKCKVLATRLQNPDLLNWVNSELEGYADREAIPEYRRLWVGSYGNFNGPFGRYANHIAIPLSVIPEEHRDHYKTACISQSVSALDDLIKNAKSEQLQIPWSADLVAYIAENVLENMVCISAWQQISRSELVAILDVVRSRVLNFALELEKINPEIGSSREQNGSILPAQVSQIFSTVIMGNVGQYSSVDQSQNLQIEVKTGDVQSLREYLLANKVSEEDYEELLPLLEQLRTSQDPDWSKSLKEWFGNMMGKAASGIWGVGMSMAANVLTTAISNYLGLK